MTWIWKIHKAHHISSLYILTDLLIISIYYFGLGQQNMTGYFEPKTDAEELPNLLEGGQVGKWLRRSLKIAQTFAEYY